MTGKDIGHRANDWARQLWNSLNLILWTNVTQGILRRVFHWTVGW